MGVWRKEAGSLPCPCYISCSVDFLQETGDNQLEPGGNGRQIRSKEWRMRRLTSQNGVNYIQMLLVIVTAGIIAALAVPYLLNQGVEELQELARQRADRIALAQEEYYASHGLFTMQRDSLLTTLADSTDLIDPTSDFPFLIGTANAGQDFSISSTGDFYILIVTEDRLDNLQVVRQLWHNYQLSLGAQGERRIP